MKTEALIAFASIVFANIFALRLKQIVRSKGHQVDFLDRRIPFGKAISILKAETSAKKRAEIWLVLSGLCVSLLIVIASIFHFAVR